MLTRLAVSQHRVTGWSSPWLEWQKHPWGPCAFAGNKLLNFVSRSLLEEVTGIQDRQWCGYSTGSVRASPGGPKEIWWGTGPFVPGHHCTQSGD